MRAYEVSPRTCTAFPQSDLIPTIVMRGRTLIPAVCDVSVTNRCNAGCPFCSFARDKMLSRPRWMDAERFNDALPVLRRRGIRYLTFQGGEPLLHRDIEVLVSQSRGAGMRVGLITNGWSLPYHIEPLVQAGLGVLFVSIDSHSIEAHERNRGLPGLGERIREGLSRGQRLGITTIASVTVNRLIDFERLPSLLIDLGFNGVNFSYPRREDAMLSPLAFGTESPLTDYDNSELPVVYEAIKALKAIIPVLNPRMALDEMVRRARGQEERFPCVRGHKYFCLDWDLNIWRCETWPQPMGSVFDLDHIPDERDRCSACTISCYRDASVLMHAGVVAGDAARALKSGRIDRAAAISWRRSFLLSVRAIVEDRRFITRFLQASKEPRTPARSGFVAQSLPYPRPR